jgi:prohibitin 1
VSITLRILFRPKPEALPQIYTNLGVDYDERVLPSITTEVLKAVVVSLKKQYLLMCRSIVIYMC